ncbi:hypothetical protein OESDEN_00445 [Oesophagostomum dentatum]|uniref:G-protein coupled receptors family 1 profile domain-containing protein n=1 Tax=Oesophagostomum dentatum TaxID=61180 RepID=A0A0B1TPW1_OESDE|nr:hypothetical protein OESDEN_00445 [Oesophagostomum dentatum]
MGQFFCNVYLASDVTCSTASILNLLAISLDRYIAISHPISYAQYGTQYGRAVVSISIVWAVSVVVGLPILLGVNPMEEDASVSDSTKEKDTVRLQSMGYIIPLAAAATLQDA